MTAVVAAVLRSGRTFLGGASLVSWATWGADMMRCRASSVVAT
jgi:hypothetical protein